MNTARKFVPIIVILFSSLTAVAGEKKISVDPATVLSTLDRQHPRLMLKDEELRALKQRYAKDRVLQRYVAQVLASADACTGKPMLTYAKVGPRLLHVSRECLRRVYALGLAYRWTGEKKYAKKATENLLAVCAFKDWNPSHFLDTAEMSHAVGVGYDWLFGFLDETNRRTIRDALIKHGMEPGMLAYTTRAAWWARSEFNWNQVCNSGLLIGALAIADTDPKYARFIVPKAVASLPIALAAYDPDGLWMEGPAYWHYATRYTAYGLTALNTALGTDFGLSKRTGLEKTGFFPIYTTGPTGHYLNFADAGEFSRRGPMPCLFWLARTYETPFFAGDEHAVLTKSSAGPEHVMWYVPASNRDAYTRDLDRVFGGKVEVAVFRSKWDDPDALFVGIKSGYNQVNHGHLDLGNFELDALGVRWARDLGSDDYNLPGYWAKGTGGRRWSYYRLNSASHNVPMLGGKSQDPKATSRFIKQRTDTDRPFVVVDLTSAYKKFADKVTRGLTLLDHRRAVLVQDEFEIKNACELTWGLTTDADLARRRDGSVELTLKGKRLIARLLSPADAAFSVVSAEQKKPQKRNKGVKRLRVRIKKAEGSIRVAVLLAPVWPDGPVLKTADLLPLDNW